MDVSTLSVSDRQRFLGILQWFRQRDEVGASWDYSHRDRLEYVLASGMGVLDAVDCYVLAMAASDEGSMSPAFVTHVLGSWWS